MCVKRDSVIENRKRRQRSTFYHTLVRLATAAQSFLQDPAMGKEKDQPVPLARRPDNSAFKQQRLPAWSPMLTANTVLPFFYLTALLCMLLGVWLLVTVQGTQEFKVSLRFSLFHFLYFFKPVEAMLQSTHRRGRD